MSLRQLVRRYGVPGLAVYAAWSAFDGVALWPTFQLLGRVYARAWNLH